MEAEIYETAKLSISYLKPFHQRFIVIEESLSGHCCFGYTILDTQKGRSGEYWNSRVCETFEKEDAVKICYALNQQYKHE